MHETKKLKTTVKLSNCVSAYSRTDLSVLVLGKANFGLKVQ